MTTYKNNIIMSLCYDFLTFTINLLVIETGTYADSLTLALLELVDLYCYQTGFSAFRKIAPILQKRHDHQVSLYLLVNCRTYKATRV